MSWSGKARRGHTLGHGVAAVTLIVAASVLAGSLLDVAALTTVVPGGARMVPATALAFALCAVSLWLTASERFAVLAQVCAVLVLLIASLRLSTYVFGWPGSFDALGISIPALTEGASLPRMSPATALSFMVLAAALLFTHHTHGGWQSQTLALLALLAGSLGLTRYVYGGEPLLPFAAMAIHTAILFIILGAGVLSVRKDVGLTRLLASKSAGGSSARRLLPATVILPLALAWLPIHAQQVGWLGSEAAIELFALSTVAVFGALVWVNALYLERLDMERRHAEREARAAEERTRLIIENALDAVITIDGDGAITGWSGQAEATFGWARADVTGRLLAEIIIPERYREAHRSGLRRFLATGEARVLNRRIELAALHRDQHELPIEIAITPVRVGGAVAFSAFVRDITERKRAEAELRVSGERLRTLAESLPNLVWTCRADGWCDYLSRQWVEYTGRPESEQLGSGWAEHLHPDDRAHVEREWALATARGDSFDVEFRIRRFDGLYRWFRTRAVPLRDAAGKVVKWFGSNTDIEDYKVSEQKLRTQLERMGLLDRITRAIADRQDPRSILQVVIHSLEGDLPVDFACVYISDSARSRLSVGCVGAKNPSLAAQLVEHTVVEGDGHGLSRCVRGQLINEPNLAQLDSPFAQRLAAAGLGSVVMAPLIVESLVFGVLVTARHGVAQFSSPECEFLRQLSEHVALAMHQAELYGALQSAYDDLRESQSKILQQERLRALGQMASGIAHDINNALSPAALYAQSLLEHEVTLSARAREYLVVIQRAIEDVAETVARMKEFYRQRGGDLIRAAVDLPLLIRQVIDLTRARWHDMPQERGAVIRLETALAPDLPSIMGAEAELRDALTNLVFNAVDAMPEGGALTLRAVEADPGYVCVEVIDTGIGMDQETRARCLEPFFTTKGERGTGLGLAMVYGAIERHGGEVQVESEPGQGTTIRLLFPVGLAADAGTGEVQAMEQPSRPLRLLFIDDDPMVLKSLRDILESDGHSVVTADGGERGIEAFRAAEQDRQRFSAVITDLGMPHVDGRKVAAAVKAAAPHVPVLLLTGWGHRLLAENDTPENVDRVLSKPPRLAELRRALAELTREQPS